MDDLNEMSMLSAVGHCFLSSIGLPFNTFILYGILAIEEINNRTRYVLFSGMIIGNMSIFIGLLNQVTFFIYRHQIYSNLYQFINGLPYLIFFANYLLVLIDYYIEITRPVWHLSKCTVSNVIPCQIGFTLLVCLIAKFFYFIGCCLLTVEETEMMGLITLILLILSCVTLKIALFIRIITLNNKRQCEEEAEQQEEQIEMDTFVTYSATSTAAIIEVAAVLPPAAAAAGPVYDCDAERAVMEKEAMYALMLSLLPSLLIVYIPRTLIFVYSTLICPQMCDNRQEAEMQCYAIEKNPFIAGYTALHGIMQPMCFVWLCDQFRTAWQNQLIRH